MKLEATGKSGPARVVMDRLLTPAELVAGWTDFKVELDDFAPGPVQLRLGVVPEPPAEVDFAAVVSAPRIWSASGVSGGSERPNLVLISLDTLRADHLSLYGYSRPTSPRLDSWVRDHRSVTFRQVVPPSGWTLPSHFSLFTGLEAFRHPANYYRMAVDASAYSFLAELLREAGYRTQAFTAGGFVHPIYGLAKGFDSFAYLASTELRLQELEMSLARVGSWLDEGREEPFLLFLHTYEIHTPNPARQPYFDQFSDLPADWTVDVANDPTLPDGGFLAEFHPVIRQRPEEAAGLVPAALTDLPRDAYDSAIAFTDEKLAPLLQRLTEPPFDRNTVVVLFSDHGESFGELGRWGHANLTLSNLRVPLVVVLPGQGKAATVPSQVRLIDLFPTLLELAGVAVPQGIDGESLGPLLAGAQEPAGRAAFAYSASTNHGLSLLSPGGLKLDWRNSVWKPIASELVWFRTREFDEEPLAAAPDDRRRKRDGPRHGEHLRPPGGRPAAGGRESLRPAAPAGHPLRSRRSGERQECAPGRTPIGVEVHRLRRGEPRAARNPGVSPGARAPARRGTGDRGAWRGLRRTGEAHRRHPGREAARRLVETARRRRLRAGRQGRRARAPPAVAGAGARRHLPGCRREPEAGSRRPGLSSLTVAGPVGTEGRVARPEKRKTPGNTPGSFDSYELVTVLS